MSRLDCKYIYYKDFQEQEHVVVFDMFTNHDEMARRCRATKENIFSAGFISFGIDGCHLYGKSESLGINSNADHNDTVTKLLGLKDL